MSADQLIILVTGGVARGKTTFLERLHASTERWWRSCGFFSVGEERARGSGAPSAVYRLKLIGRADPLPWARRRGDGSGLELCEETRLEASSTVKQQLDAGLHDLLFLDEIGRLELGGQGFAQLLRQARKSSCRVVVAAVKKSLLAEVVSEFGLDGAFVIDLDEVPAARALRDAKRRIAACDAERIGMFAGIAGLVEVGLGSSLHAYRVPFKGHALAYLQTVLLVAFGKALRGRGLVRITFISAMLKAFSPVGSTFRPMAYIFMQGVSFAAPIRVFGWNIGAVLAGSVIMSWLTLGLSLAVDYVTFGRGIFDAFGGAIRAVSGWLGLQGPTLAQVIVGAFLLKAALACVLGAGAYYWNMQPLLHRLSTRRVGAAIAIGDRSGAPQRSFGRITVQALRDLVRPRFLLAFMLSGLLLLFFAGLSRADLVNLLIRGLCISYFGFVAMRRIDARGVGEWLDKRAGLGLSKSLPAALEMLGQKRAEAAVNEPGVVAVKARVISGGVSEGSDAKSP
ncbi:MAG TPA: hypothetical protein DFS52_07870 [Myxococcales bacterium]|jgi:nucleoside-triphosphatase THEP1|nr:hypothetical protein [Myxococcales bacterium]